MRTAQQRLAQYAAYHRDRRNIATHFVGVPMIVFGVGVFPAPVNFAVNGVAITLAWLAFAAVALWYLSRGLVIGLATSAVVGMLILLAHRATEGSVASWLAWGLDIRSRAEAVPARRRSDRSRNSR